MEPADRAAYRKSKFAVEITPAKYPEVEGERKVSVTHNGYQWYAMDLTPDEMRALIAAMQKELGDDEPVLPPGPTTEQLLKHARHKDLETTMRHVRRMDALRSGQDEPTE